MYRGRLDAAEVRHKKAFALNPYDARILALWSPLATYLGKPDEGRRLIEKAMRLNPYHPGWYDTNLGLACYGTGAYADGAAAYACIPEPQTGARAGLAACLAQSGNRDASGVACDELLKRTPSFRSELFVATRPFKHREDRLHWLEGLRKAGLP